MWDRTNRPVWLRCAVGIILAVIAAAIRLQFMEILGFRAAFLTFYPAVAVAALYGGLGPGLLATAVSAILVDYFWLEPVGSLAITNSADLLSMVVFLASGALISYLAEAAYRAQARAHKAEEHSRLAAEREKAAVDLQQSESKYRELVQNANSAIIRWKRDGTLTFFNEYAQKFFGYSAEEVIGKSVNILVPEQESTGGDLTGLFQDIVNHPERYASNINENILRDGSRVWMAWTNRPVFDRDGQVLEILAVGSDITERKRMEETLRTTVQRFHRILSNIFVGILVVTEDNRIEFANQNFCDQFDIAEAPSDLIGLTAEEMLQKVLPAYAYPEAYLGRVQQILSQRHRIEDEEVLMRNGRVLLRDHIPILVDGKPHGRMWQHRDITQRKGMEEALRKSEKKYQTLFNSIIEGFCIIEMIFDDQGNPADYRFLEINPKFEEQTGLSDAEGKLMRELAPDHEEHWFEIYGRIALTGEPERFVNEARALNRWYDVYAFRLGDPESRKVAICFSDITERKRAEDEAQSLQAAIRQERDTLSALVSSIPDEVWFADAQKKFTLANPSALREFALDSDSDIDIERFAASLEVFRPDGGPRPVEEAPPLRSLKGEVVRDLEETVRIPASGELRHRQVSSSPVRGADGDIIGSVSVVRDITERKRAEVLLQRQAELLYLSYDAIIVWRLEGIIESWNRGAEELYGYSKEEAVGRVTHELLKTIHPEPWPQIEAKLHERKFWEGELKHHTREGLEVIISARHQLVRGADGVERVLEINRDITESKRVEEALRASERLYRAIGESIDYGVWVCAPDGRNIYASESFLKLVGITQQECSDFGWGNVLHPEDAERTIAAWRECVRTGGIWDIEHRFLGVDGQWRSVLARGVPVRDEAGEIVYWAGINLDISARKQMEEDIRKARDELELRVQERTAELNSYMTKLERSNQALQDFAYIAAHDMKEPLRKVMSFGNLLSQKYKDSLTQTGNDYLNRMLHATERMQSLLTGLLDYSRVATAAEPFKEVGLSGLIGEIVSDLEVRIVKTGGEVHVGDLPVISADPTQMRQLFQNLIGNALKFHKPGEKPIVQVRCVSDIGSGSQIVVEDDGIGFDEQHLERIFAPFQRLHGRSEYEGTGMGLAICKKIVERHGWSITAKSAPGAGSTFIITLPQGHATPPRGSSTSQ